MGCDPGLSSLNRMATSTKAALREQLLLARRNVADEVRAAETRMLGEHAELAGQRPPHGLRLRAGGHRAGVHRDAECVATRGQEGAAAGCAHRRRRHRHPRCGGASTGRVD